MGQPVDPGQTLLFGRRRSGGRPQRAQPYQLNADDIVCQHHATLLAVLKNLDDIAANRVQPMVDDVTLAERAVGEAVEHLQELASELKLEGRFFTLRAYRRIGQHRRDITVSWQSKSGSLPTQIGPNLTARELAEVLVELRQG